MNIKDFKISNKLFIAFAIILSATSIVEVYLSSKDVKNSRYESARELSSSINASLTISSDLWLSNLSDNISSAQYLLNLAQNTTRLTNFIQQSSGADLAYFALDSGEFYMSRHIELPSGFNPQTREWFTKAKASQQAVMTSPYVDAATGNTVVSVSKSVARQQLSGVIGIDIPVSQFAQSLISNDIPFLKSIVVDKSGAIIAADNDKLILKNIAEISEFTGKKGALTISLLEELSKSRNITDLETSRQNYLVSARQMTSGEWFMVSLIDRDQYLAPVDEYVTNAVTLQGIQLVALLLLVKFLITFLLKPLERLNSTIKALSEGDCDLTQSLPVSSRDEIGVISENVNRFLRKLRTIVESINQSSSMLTQQSVDTTDIVNKSKNAVGTQNNELSMITVAIQEMAHTAEEVSTNSTIAAEASMSSLEQCDVGRSVIIANQQSIADLSTQISDSAVVIQAVEQNAQDIKAILSTINDIAEQTNLLALNAAIEAARAGDQGRGFAVVADEVRVLSQRTRSSTSDIQEMIERLQSSSLEAVTSMETSQSLAEASVLEADKATHALVEIAEKIAQISDMNSQISAAVTEQKVVTNEVSVNIQSVNDVATGMESEIASIESASQEILLISEKISEQVKNFKV